MDQIQDELAVEKEKGEATAFEIDDDLPGQGQFYCTPCARHFTDAETKRVHIKSKLHKRRRVIGECYLYRLSLVFQRVLRGSKIVSSSDKASRMLYGTSLC